MRKLTIPALGFVLLAGGTLRAGPPDGPYWVEIALPAGIASPVKGVGTLVVFQTASDVHLWSAITRQWTVVPVSGSAYVSQFNAYAIIEDGCTVHGYATRTGVVDTLTLAAPPVVHSGSPSSCWLSIAQLGSDLYSFGAFHGRFEHLAAASPAASVTINQTTGVVYDGVNAYGVSAYHGDFVPTPAAGAVFPSASGDVGIADDAATARGFSAHTNAWAVTAFPNPTGGILKRGYALYTSGQNVLAFSGYTGSFVSFTAATSGYYLQTDTNVAAVIDGNDVACYAAGINVFANQTFAAPQVMLEDDFALVIEPSALTAFSGVTGSYAAPLAGSFTLGTNEAVAWADGPSGSYAYSVVQNAWSAAPSASTAVSVLRNAVVQMDAAGCHGFSGRSGTWAFQPSSTPFVYEAHAGGDVFVGLEGNTMRVFDPILLRWEEVTTAAPASLDLWRQTVVGTDGVNAYGVGLMNSEWDQIPLKGNLVKFDANSSCGFVETDTHLYTYTAHGSFSTLSRWPEFTRFQPKGVDLRLIQAAPAGSSVLMFVGFAPAYIPAGGLGALFIDPSLLLIIGLGSVPPSGVLDLAVPVPNLPALNGVAVHMQNGVVSPSGVQWLTSAIAPVFF
ncbi:MAG: hypothetical protein HY812_14060 [Planctomycetes bacterium]|nr:hypothetical protein [Planctomycetota bacterium]